MFLFLRLLLAHFIGDFPFQADQIYREKMHSIQGQILHGLIIGVLCAIFSWPFLSHPAAWGLILVFIVSHIFIDWLKIRIDKKKIPVFWAFLMDQLLHISVLSLVFLFDFSRDIPNIQHPLFSLYNSNKLIALVTTYIIVTFAGTYLLDTFKKNYFPRFMETAGSKSINYGLVERGLIMAVFCLFPIWFYPLVLILLFADIITRRKKGAFDFLLNLIYAGIGGLIIKAVFA